MAEWSILLYLRTQSLRTMRYALGMGIWDDGNKIANSLKNYSDESLWWQLMCCLVQVWGVEGGPYEFMPAAASSFSDRFSVHGEKDGGLFVLQEWSSSLAIMRWKYHFILTLPTVFLSVHLFIRQCCYELFDTNDKHGGWENKWVSRVCINVRWFI